MRLIPQLLRVSLLIVATVHAVGECNAGFSHQVERSASDHPVSQMLLRSLEQEARDGIDLQMNMRHRHWFAERLFLAQLQARFLDTLSEGFNKLAGTDDVVGALFPSNAIRKSRKAMVLLGEGNLDAALGEISKLEYIAQLAAIRNATAWCIETGRTEWITPILEFDYDSRAPENEVWSAKAQIEETIRPLCLRDLALKELMAGNREQGAKLALDAVSQILEFSGGATYYGIVNDLDTYLDLAGRCGVMKEAWERIRPPLLEGMLITFSADSIALQLAHSGLKDELDELLDACETAEKRLKCNAAAAWGFATAGDSGEAMIRVKELTADITDQQLQTLEPESFSYLVGACCRAGMRDTGSALIRQRFPEPGDMDDKNLIALLERADPELSLQMIEGDNLTRWHHCASAVAMACKREKKDELALSWLRAKTEELRQMNFDFSRERGIAGRLASACAILGDLDEANSVLREMNIPEYNDSLTGDEAIRDDRLSGLESYRMVAENLARIDEPEVLVEWAMGLENPLARAHAALGLFEGFAARNHRLEGWYPR